MEKDALSFALSAAHLHNARVLVVGDAMLDQYWFGKTSRISPEAPVPVVQVDRIDERPGGAANVALGIAALGATPTLLCATGDDAAAARLEHLLSIRSIPLHFIRSKQQPTITKLRVLCHNQQMIRLDNEKRFTAEICDQLKARFLKQLPNQHAIVLSDYGKGTLGDPAWFIAEARAHNIPVIVDPKSSDFSIYRHANLIKPNLQEFEAVVGCCRDMETMISKALLFLAHHHIDTLVISRSEHGLSVITRQGEVTHLPTDARAVYDVTGAGDTVIAVLATALASGVDLLQAAILSNVAAGIAVGSLGATQVSVHEIQSAIGRRQPAPIGIMTEEALLSAVRISKAKGERIVFTNGCFDILHAGHILYLEEAKRLGDRIIVAINDDASVARLKGPSRPINSLENRMAVLASLKSVDWVIPFSEDTPERIIQNIIPHILVKGGDYNRIETLAGAEFVLSHGGQVKLLGLKEGCSTTALIKAIATRVP